MADRMVADRVVIVGGGLAGITAALRLADAGREVILVEARPRLGGAAFSFRRGELSVDNGQHVFLRCCEAYRWFLARISMQDKVILQDRLDIPVLSPDGRRAALRRLPNVPAPLHLTAALAGYGLLGLADRARAALGALALRRLDPSDPSLDARSLGEYLRAHGQNDATIDALWGIVVTATLNKQPDDASLALAAKVFRTGLLDRADAGDVGYAAVPLGELHSTAAAAALAASGVEVLLQHKAIRVAPGAVDVTGDGRARRLEAGSVVLAVPPGVAFSLAPQLAATDAAPARELGASPIVNVHLVYDRQVTDLPFAAAVGSPVQWLFDRTATSGLRANDPDGQYLAVTVSAADGIVDVPTGELVARFTTALADLLPAARRATVRDAFVTRERSATFDQSPGCVARRPAPGAGLPGVHLAGAWTDTGWPDTMESAVRSGIVAAESALALEPDDVWTFAA